MNRRRSRAAASLAILATFASPAVASAEPPDPEGVTRAQVENARRDVTQGESKVAAVQRRLDAARAALDDSHRELAVSAEKANAARELLRTRTANAAAARVKAQRAAKAEKLSRAAVEQMATDLYMRGGVDSQLAWLYVDSTADLARTRADLQAAEGYRASHYADARKARTDAAAARKAAEEAAASQREAANAAAAALTEAQAAATAAERRETEVTKEQEKLVAELARLRRTSVEVERRHQAALQRRTEEREAAAAAARVTRQAAAATTAGAVGETVAEDLPAPDSATAGAAIAWAQAQLGKPYQWGGNGPASFDCSGLMVGAWRSAGRQLPRTAQWQYGATKRVAIADLQPGDLVFFGGSPSSIYHVGMYVGGGKMIEAPRTGLNIRYSSIYRSSLLPFGGRV